MPFQSYSSPSNQAKERNIQNPKHITYFTEPHITSRIQQIKNFCHLTLFYVVTVMIELIILCHVHIKRFISPDKDQKIFLYWNNKPLSLCRCCCRFFMMTCETTEWTWRQSERKKAVAIFVTATCENKS